MDNVPDGWMLCLKDGKEVLRRIVSHSYHGPIMLPDPAIGSDEVVAWVLGDDKPMILPSGWPE